jgi:hypothetical protein
MSILPVKFAEPFDFGRENPTGTSDLALSSPDGESRRPVGKDECRGNPKGKPAGGAFSFGYFSLGMQRKVTRPAGRNQMLMSKIQLMFAAKACAERSRRAAPTKSQNLCVLCDLCGQ